MTTLSFSFFSFYCCVLNLCFYNLDNLRVFLLVFYVIMPRNREVVVAVLRWSMFMFLPIFNKSSSQPRSRSSMIPYHLHLRLSVLYQKIQPLLRLLTKTISMESFSTETNSSFPYLFYVHFCLFSLELCANKPIQ